MAVALRFALLVAAVAGSGAKIVFEMRIKHIFCKLW